MIKLIDVNYRIQINTELEDINVITLISQYISPGFEIDNKLSLQLGTTATFRTIKIRNKE